MILNSNSSKDLTQPAFIRTNQLWISEKPILTLKKPVHRSQTCRGTTISKREMAHRVIGTQLTNKDVESKVSPNLCPDSFTSRAFKTQDNFAAKSLKSKLRFNRPSTASRS